MRFKDLSEDDKLHMKNTYLTKELTWDQKMRTLEDYLGVTNRTVRNWLVELGFKNKVKEDSPQFVKAKKRKVGKKSKRYIVTWAQNNTPVHEPFLRNIEAYAKEIGAEILVIAGRYKNPTSIFTDKDSESWHSRFEPYLYANRENIHKHVVVVGDVKISPTAVTPMTGMRGFSGSESCIFGHPKVQMEMVSVLEGIPSKMMMTTGSCTVSNYTDSKAGKKGGFHHTLGFVVIEVKNKEVFFPRQVTAEDNGDFNDLYYNVKFEGSNEVNVVSGLKFIGNQEDWTGKSKVSRNKTIKGAILGDMHFGEHDQSVIDATTNILFKKLKPEAVVLHDVFDGHSISHHDRKDPYAQYQKEIEDKNNLKKEVQLMLDGLKPFEKYNTIIVRSNHDDFLDRWLRDVNWKKDGSIKNAPAYMEYSTLIFTGMATKGIIPHVISECYPKMITLGRSDSYRICDWEVGQHGDKGANGARGSIVGFKGLNTKMIIGHSHSPNRKDGVVQVGTTTHKRVGYNVGASSWFQSHAIIHEDGKVQQIGFIKGEFTTFE